MKNNGNSNVKEKEILELIPKENSWEQILYEVVALKDLDPWNLNLNVLSRGFADYISALREVDFRIPAKWVIIACVLLRMKSDYIKIIKSDEEHETEDEFLEFEDLEEFEEVLPEQADVEPLEAVPKRKPVRRVTLTELVDSLRRVLRAEKRREKKLRNRRNRISISNEDITRRIERLYSRISGMITRIKKNEIQFSKLVNKWERDEVVDTFLPLVHLDHEKKVSCRQQKMFDEIFIKKRRAAS